LVADGIGRNQSDRVLLLTDGLANRGITGPEQLTALARQKREAGVTTTTIGVGMDFNEDLLKTMSPVLIAALVRRHSF
jgi:Ca-activated chloride channel family protein